LASRYSIFSLLRESFRGHRGWEPAWRDAEPRTNYDVIIVGGGGHGLATAYYLAKNHGIRNVAVVEKGYIGSGNVGRNTTIVRSNYLLPGNAPFYEWSLKLWEGLEQDINYNAMVSQRGVLNLFHSDSQRDAFVRRGVSMRLHGVDGEFLGVDDIRKLLPMADFDNARFPIRGGLLQPRGGTVRHDAVAWGYARAANALGVDIIEDCAVTGVRTSGQAASGVETTRGYVQAERIVFATAGHTGLVGTMLGVALPIETHLLQAMVSEPIKPLLNTVVVYVSPGHGETYICQSDRGGLVMGGHLDGFPSYTREGQWHRLEDVVQGAVELFPRIGGVKILRQWAGTNDMTMDGSPIIDRLRFDNVFVNAGWCYGGFKAIPASGAACAQLVATGTAPDLIKAYRLSRFATGHMLDEPGQGPFPVRL